MSVNFYWDAKYNSAYLYILFFHLLYLFEIDLRILNNIDKIKNITYILKNRAYIYQFIKRLIIYI